MGRWGGQKEQAGAEERIKEKRERCWQEFNFYEGTSHMHIERLGNNEHMTLSGP